MWSYYDWVYCCCPSVTDDNDNSIITRPQIVFTDGRQQRQLNHNTTTYCVNTICGRIMIGLSLLSFVSIHNMWLCYDWVVVVMTIYCVY
jgi:hypothetical protein